MVSEDFYAKIIPYFSAKEVAFVQAKIRSDGFLGDEVERFFQDRIKACFLSCGHSVVFRAEVLRENPLPETMGEDILYSIDLFSKGYKSVLADVWTYDVGMGPIEFLARDIKWAGNEKLFIRKIPALLKSKIPLAKKLEIFSDLTRSITAIMIIVELVLFPLDPWTQLICIALGCLISRVRPKNALVAPGLIFFTAYGFLKHMPRDLRVSRPTSSLNHNEVKLLLAFFMFVCSAFIYLHRNALAFSYLLLSLILVACHSCRKGKGRKRSLPHAAHRM